MAGAVSTIHVDGPIDRVFEVFADIPNCGERIPEIVRIEMLSDGPVGVGTRWRETRVMFKKEATEELEITDFDPPKGYVVEAESCGARCRTEFRFQESSGRTRVEMEMSVRPVTFMAWLMTPMAILMKRMLKKALDKDLQALKAHLEGPGAESDSTATAAT